MLHILTVTYLVLTGNAASPDEGSLSELSTPQDACVVPLEGDTAVYDWTQGGCLLGWSQYFNTTYNATAADVSETDLDVDFNTCEAGAHGLGVCPWESRDDDHGPLAVKSPKHCNVNKVWFQVSSTMTSTEEILSAEWTGVKLVDSRDYTIVIRSWTNSIFGPSLDEELSASVVWDGIPTNKCYRLLVQVGSTGHIEVKDVNFRIYEPSKMLVDVDVKFAKEDPLRGLHIRTKHGDCSGLGNTNCRCLDSPEHTENKGKIHMWTCFREYPNQPASMSTYNQQWTYDSATGQIKNIHGQCLDANNGGSEDHTEVWIWECDTANKNQQWDYDWTTGQIKNAYGQCLNAPNKGNTNDGLVHMYDCDTSNEDQQWLMYQGSDWEPAWEYVGTWICSGAIQIGTAKTLEDAKKLMLANEDCLWEGSLLFYSEYSYDAAWSVLCVPGDGGMGQCTDDENWQVYQLHYGHQTQGEWDEVEGDLLISSDATGGIDSNYDLQHTSVFTVGASYILDSSLAPTVVTDIKLIPTDEDSVDCPFPYETKAVIGQVRGAGATNIEKEKGSNKMALCVKKQTCAMKVEYVTQVGAIATSDPDLSAFTLPDGCEMIGTWDPNWAKSHTSGEVGQYTTGLYQCKSSCASETCAKVKITAMEATGIPEINQKANVVNNDASQTVKGCGLRPGDSPNKETVYISSGEDITNKSSYTLDKSLGRTFSGTVSTRVDVSAEAGFSVWGATVKGKAEFGLSTSMSSGFSSTQNSGRSELHSTSKTAIVTETAHVAAYPGEQVKVVVTSSQLNYSTQFKAMAQCINKNGEVTETKPVSGKFTGRAHVISGSTGTFASKEFCEGSSSTKWNCVCCKLSEQTKAGQCQDQQRRRLVDRLFGY